MARPHNIERLKLIADLHQQLKSNKQVAKRMGISKSAVIRARQRWATLSTDKALTDRVQ